MEAIAMQYARKQYMDQLIRKITDEVYHENGVVLAAVGVYLVR